MEESKLSNNCINSQQYNLEDLYYLCNLATTIKELNQTKEGANFLSSLLNHKRVTLYFNQPSTRTFLSFQNACYILGMKCSEIKDTNTSSFAKGESEIDAVKTFSNYVDLMIIRHCDENFIKLTEKEIGNNLKIINAGSGTDQHPTQALLDFYTIYNYGLKNKKIGFVGDLKRGRTVRSLSLLLNKIKGIELFFIAPNEFQIKEDILNELKVEYTITENIEKVISQLDVIYMTRLQSEYGGIDCDLDIEKYSLNKAKLKYLKKDSIIMHPLPRNGELNQDVDSDERAKYWEQVENGMWIRAALIATMFEVDKQILDKNKVLLEV